MAKSKASNFSQNLGIVVSDREIVLLEGKIKGEKFYILKAARELVKEKNFVENGRIKDHQAVILKIREILDKLKPAATCASINIPAHLALIKNIPLDSDIIEKFPDWIEWEVSNYILRETRDFEISYVPLNAQTPNGELMLIAATPKDVIRERIRILEALDFCPVAADPDPVAAYNAFISFSPEAESGNYLIIDISLPNYFCFATFNGKFIYGGVKYTSLDYRELESGQAPGALYDSLAKELHSAALEFFSSYGDFPQNADGIILIGYFAPSEPLKRSLKNFFLPPVLNNLPFNKKRLKFKVGEGFADVWASYIVASGLALRRLDE